MNRVTLATRLHEPPRLQERHGAPASRRPARPQPNWTVATVAELRAAAYRLLAALLLYPDEQRLHRLSGTAGDLQQYGDELAAFAFFAPWQRLLVLLQELTERDVAALQAEHVRLFSLDSAGAPCFPYESCYVSPGSQETGWLTARLQHTYSYAGLRLAPSLNESPDHAAVELEFMAFLCGQEAAAWAAAARADGIRGLKRQRSFLRHHLGQWFSVFARQVQARTTARLYAAAAVAGAAFIQHDRDLVEALLGDIEQLEDRAGPPGRTDADLTTERAQ